MGRGHRLHVRPVPRASREDQALAEELPVRGDLREAALDAGDDRGGGPRRDPARRADRGGPRGGGVMKDQAIVEAALFSAGAALTAEELAKVTGFDPGKVKEHLRKLAKDYEARGSAIEVVSIGTKWTMQIQSAYTERARTLDGKSTRLNSGNGYIH